MESGSDFAIGLISSARWEQDTEQQRRPRNDCLLENKTERQKVSSPRWEQEATALPLRRSKALPNLRSVPLMVSGHDQQPLQGQNHRGNGRIPITSVRTHVAALRARPRGLCPRPLPSTGVTRLRRYYGPLRHPKRPSLSLTGVRLRVTRPHRMGFQCCVRSPFTDMPSSLPRWPAGP
jgi:hypothetical protein